MGDQDCCSRLNPRKGPRVGLDDVAMREIPAIAGNQTPAILLIPSRFTNLKSARIYVLPWCTVVVYRSCQSVVIMRLLWHKHNNKMQLLSLENMLHRISVS